MVAVASRRRGSRSSGSVWLRFVPFLLVAVGAALVTLGYAFEVGAAVVFLVAAATVGVIYRFRPLDAVLLTWTVAVFEGAASKFVPGQLSGIVKQADEPLVLFLLVATFLAPSAASKASTRFLRIPVIGFLFAGWVSNVLSLTGIPEALLGAYTGVKFFALLFITMHLPWKPGDAQRVFRWMSVVVGVVMALGVFNLVLPGVYQSLIPVQAGGVELRFGLTGIQSVFTHPDHFGSFSTIFAVVFIARFVATGQRRYLYWGLGCLTLGVLSLRLKVILGFAAALAALSMAATQKFLQRFGIGVLLILVFLSAGGGFIVDLTTTQLDRYLFGDSTTIRETLYVTSGEIARDNFPFGEGFGRFGSGASTTFDSPVYNEYGLTRSGLTVDDPGTRHDTTWPTILGETGVVGMAFFLGGLVVMWARLRRLSLPRTNADSELRWVALAGFAVLSNVFLETLGRPSFFNAVTSLTVAILVGMPLEIGARQSSEAGDAVADAPATPAAVPAGGGPDSSVRADSTA